MSEGAANWWKDFSSDTEVRRYERVLIECALKDAEGSVTRAAQFLGFKHHQSLIWRINNRHKTLLKARSEVRPRRRSIIVQNTRTRRSANHTTEKKTGNITIMHVEDSELIAGLVRNILVFEGWDVDQCRDAESALKKLARKAYYDILVFDYQLPGLNGVELVRRTRKISRRRRTPIIMLSGTDCETEAWRAGVDAFLRKGEDINALPSTIARLLKVQLKNN